MITDNLLVGMAELAAGGSYSVAAFGTVSSDSGFTASATTDSVSDELDSRTSISPVRTDKTVNFSFVRSGAVASSDGDVLYGVALMPSSTGDGCQIAIELPGLTQTQNFDIDFDVDITIRRN